MTSRDQNAYATPVRVPVSPRTNLPFGWGRGRCEVTLHGAGKGGRRNCGSTASRVCSNPECRTVACGLHGTHCRCRAPFVAVYITAIAFAECAACPTLVAYNTQTGEAIDAGASTFLRLAYCAKCSQTERGAA